MNQPNTPTGTNAEWDVCVQRTSTAERYSRVSAPTEAEARDKALTAAANTEFTGHFTAEYEATGVKHIAADMVVPAATTLDTEDDDRYHCPIHGQQDGPDCARC